MPTNWDKVIPTTTTTSTTATITTTGTTTSDWVTTYRPASPGGGWFVVDSGDYSCVPSISYRPDPILPSLSDMDNCIALWPDQFHSEAEADLGIFALTVYIRNVWKRDYLYSF